MVFEIYEGVGKYSGPSTTHLFSPNASLLHPPFRGDEPRNQETKCRRSISTDSSLFGPRRRGPPLPGADGTPPGTVVTEGILQAFGLCKGDQDQHTFLYQQRRIEDLQRPRPDSRMPFRTLTPSLMRISCSPCCNDSCKETSHKDAGLQKMGDSIFHPSFVAW